MTTGITLVIALINIVVEISIQLGSEKTRPINITILIIDSIKGISWIQFINLSLIILMISLKGDENPFLSFFEEYGFFQGKYADFSCGWFKEYGALLLKTMTIEIAIPHILPLL